LLVDKDDPVGAAAAAEVGAATLATAGLCDECEQAAARTAHVASTAIV
jgi:hypothetical protein